MKNSITVIFSSHLGEEANNKFIGHIRSTIGVKHYAYCYENYNQYSLTEIYNRAIDEHDDSDTVMVFCHNDIVFKSMNWGRMLLTKFNSTDYSIIGVAGSTYMPASGMWWEDRSKMVGIVEHTDGINTWVSEYSPERKGQITPVVLIDGLFMAVDCSNIEHRFDEEFKGYHLYDISFCLSNYISQVDIGVTTDIRILHKSVGMVNKEWDLNRIQLANKYKNELPLSI